MWVKPYLSQFLKGDQQVLSIIGKPGCGKTVLSTVINDYLQHPVGGTRYTSILVPISQSRMPQPPFQRFPNQPLQMVGSLPTRPLGPSP